MNISFWFFSLLIIRSENWFVVSRVYLNVTSPVLVELMYSQLGIQCETQLLIVATQFGE